MNDSFDFDRYGSLRERDIDLVVCLASASLPGVWGLFGTATEAPRVSHSVNTFTGEIDVTLCWPGRDVHVENKLDAGFQPNQAERYRARALKADIPTDTVLLAPIAYLEAHVLEADQFDRTVSYEQLVEELEAESSPVGFELALMVRHAIEQHRRGPVSEVSDARTEFFHQFAVRSAQRGLPFVDTGNRGPRSGFFYAHSWDRVNGKKVELVAKFENHQTVDVQIAGASHVADLLTDAFASEGMTVRTTNARTLILGRAAPSLDPDSPIAQQQDALAEFMDVALEQQSWWRETGRLAVATALDAVET